MNKNYITYTKKSLEGLDRKSMNEYEKFLSNYYKEKYTAKTAEYKRMQYADFAGTVFFPVDKVFSFIVDIIVPKKEQGVFIEGSKIKSQTKQTVFLRDYKKNEVFSYIFYSGKDKQYHTITYYLKELKNGFTKVTYAHEIKRENTIAGFNGRLGTIKFKNAHKNEAIIAIKYMNEHIK